MLNCSFLLDTYYSITVYTARASKLWEDAALLCCNTEDRHLWEL